MILQKLASAIRRQDWFQVVIEVMIVIVGIFLGLQVTAWNDARLERTDEVEYLARLHQDFSQSIANNEIRMNRVYEMWEDTKTIADSLENCSLALEERDTFARGLFGMGKFVPLTLTGIAIDELKSTGRFRIIQNEEIRRAISLNMTEIINQTVIGDGIRQGIQPHLTAIEVHFAHKVEEADPTFPFPPITWDDVEIDFDKLCGIEGIRNSVTQINRYMRGYSSRAYTVLEGQRAILKMLEKEIITKS